MKSMFLAVAAVLALSVSAKAADLSSADLAQYGLSGMQTMSDAQGSQIRASGFGFSINLNAPIQSNYIGGNGGGIVTQQNTTAGSNYSLNVVKVKVSVSSSQHHR